MNKSFLPTVWRKPLLLVGLVGLGISSLWGQSGYTTAQPKMQLTCSDLTSWSIRVKAPEAQQNSIWIDWNNNAQYEEGEAVDFSLYNMSHQVTHKTITIYGHVTGLEVAYQRLTAIDVSQNSDLKDLKVNQNLLTDLDLTGNPKLELLYCYNNKLSHLRTPKNSVLRNVACYTNHIQGADMDAFIESLPDRAGQERAGKIHIVNSNIGISLENICTKKQVAALTAKNWKVYDWKDGENEGENIYLGSHDTDEENYTTTTPHTMLTSSLSNGMWLVSVNAKEEDRSSCWIDWNGNSAYDKGEEVAEFEQLLERPRQGAKVVLYGKFSAIKCAENSLQSVSFSEKPIWLQELIAQNNKLSSIDLKGATSLVLLNVDNNELTRLDLSGQTQLKTLDCYGNKLTDLKLEGCSGLKVLNCNENKLSALNLSSLSALEELNCSGNPLGSLEVGNNMALRSLYCNNTQLRELSVRNNTKLEVLYCLNNKLLNLDLKPLVLLSILNCSVNQIGELDLSKNIELTKLYVNNNKLTTLNLQDHILLTFVDCADNQLKTLSFKGNKALNQLHCNNNQLESLDLIALPALTLLQCSNNRIKELTLSATPQLKTLGCDRNRLTTLNFSQNTALSLAHIHGNAIAETQMLSALASLPSRTEEPEKKSEIVVVDLKNQEEKNQCSPEAVAKAVALNWQVKDFNGGTLIDYNGGAQAMEEVADLTCHLYPNPTTDFLFVEQAPVGASLALYTLEGVCLYQTMIGSSSIVIPMKEYPTGVYLLTIDGVSHRIAIRR